MARIFCSISILNFWMSAFSFWLLLELWLLLLSLPVIPEHVTVHFWFCGSRSKRGWTCSMICLPLGKTLFTASAWWKAIMNDENREQPSLPITYRCNGPPENAFSEWPGIQTLGLIVRRMNSTYGERILLLTTARIKHILVYHKNLKSQRKKKGEGNSCLSMFSKQVIGRL